MGGRAARIAFYLGISDLIGTVIGRAGTFDKRKSGTWVDLPGILAGGRHASSVKVCAPVYRARKTRYPFGVNKYWTEVGDQIRARKQGFFSERSAHWRLFGVGISDVRCIKALAAVQAAY